MLAQVLSPGQLPLPAVLCTVLLAAAAGATLWAGIPAHYLRAAWRACWQQQQQLGQIAQRRQKQQQEAPVVQHNQAALHQTGQAEDRPGSGSAGAVHQQRQDSGMSGQQQQQVLQTLQQWLGVLGGGLLLEVRPSFQSVDAYPTASMMLCHGQ